MKHKRACNKHGTRDPNVGNGAGEGWRKTGAGSLGFMGGFGDKASSAGHSAWDSMLPELEGAGGEEAWRLREFCRSLSRRPPRNEKATAASHPAGKWATSLALQIPSGSLTYRLWSGKARATLTLAAKVVLSNSGSGKFGLTMP